MDNTRTIEILKMVKKVLVHHLHQDQCRPSYICHALAGLDYKNHITREEYMTMKVFIMVQLEGWHSLESWLMQVAQVKIGEPNNNVADAIRMLNYRKAWIGHMIKELSV